MLALLNNAGAFVNSSAIGCCSEQHILQTIALVLLQSLQGEGLETPRLGHTVFDSCGVQFSTVTAIIIIQKEHCLLSLCITRLFT